MKKILTRVIAIAALAALFIGCDTGVNNDPDEFAEANVVEKSMFIEGFTVSGLSGNYDEKDITLQKQTIVKTNNKKEGYEGSAVTLGTAKIADSSKLYKTGEAYSLFFEKKTETKDGKTVTLEEYKDENAEPNYTYKDFEVPESIQTTIDNNNSTVTDESKKESVSAVEVRFTILVGDVSSPDAKIVVVKTASDGKQSFEGAQLDVVTSKFQTKKADLAKRWLTVTVPSVEQANIPGTFEFTKPAKVTEPKTLFYCIGDAFGNWVWESDKVITMNAASATTQTAEWVAEESKTIEFKFTNAKTWGATVNAGSDGTNKEITLGTEKVLKLGNDAQNLSLSVTKDKKYKMTLDISDTSALKLKVEEVE